MILSQCEVVEANMLQISILEDKILFIVMILLSNQLLTMLQFSRRHNAGQNNF
jgi:hypothetical protein